VACGIPATRSRRTREVVEGMARRRHVADGGGAVPPRVEGMTGSGGIVPPRSSPPRVER